MSVKFQHWNGRCLESGNLQVIINSSKQNIHLWLIDYAIYCFYLAPPWKPLSNSEWSILHLTHTLQSLSVIIACTSIHDVKTWKYTFKLALKILWNNRNKNMQWLTFDLCHNLLSDNTGPWFLVNIWVANGPSKNMCLAKLILANFTGLSISNVFKTTFWSPVSVVRLTKSCACRKFFILFYFIYKTDTIENNTSTLITIR